MQKRGKKGSSQVDWAISLGIFLLYLAWFFVFVEPFIQPERKLTSMASIVEAGFDKDSKWTVETVPIIISSDEDSDNTPIITRLPYSWQRGTFMFKDDTYLDYFDGKLIFQRDLKRNATDILYLVHSDSNYTDPSTLSDLIANERTAKNSYFTATFYNSKLYKIAVDSVKMDNLIFKVSGEEIDIINETFKSTRIDAAYKFTSGGFNHTSFIFSESDQIMSFIDPESSFDLTLSMQLAPFASFYSNNLYYGEINYSLNRCEQITASYLDFRNAAGGLSFVMDQECIFYFCYDNTTALTLDITIPVTNETEYWIIPHQGNSSRTAMRFYELRFGIVQSEQGLSINQLDKIGQRDYYDLKYAWSYPSGKDFMINVTGANSSIWGYQKVNPPSTVNIYVKEKNAWILNPDASQTDVSVRISTW